MKILFLPGVGGDPAFWRPVADRLPAAWEKTLLGWPGLGDQPPAPDVNGWDDLYRLVEQRIDGTVALVAQSMGGALALRAALARPQSVSHLVLTATSGGIDLTSFDVQDWREEYRRAYPRAPEWVYERPTTHEKDLRRLAIPTLLIWAVRDPISPPAVGRHLAGLLPNAKLIELDDDSHLFARERPDDVAPLLAAHLRRF
ncbi:MAG TPA: alpha/beta hydrolase [Vicinamibacterales bacterium]|nr:alpha/beta hydrolase [Vicinamibacterales bacterium]